MITAKDEKASLREMGPTLLIFYLCFGILWALFPWRVLLVLGLLATGLTLPLWWPWWSCAC